jgi:hypothetical protein
MLAQCTSLAYALSHGFIPHFHFFLFPTRFSTIRGELEHRKAHMDRGLLLSPSP